MAYIESFLLYVAIVIFVFVVLFGGAVLLYMLIVQTKLFYSVGGITWEKEKKYFLKIVKNRFFKMGVVVYFMAWTLFYINQSFEYYGKERAYPRAKAYAIVANTVWFWHSMMVNVALNRGWGEYTRLVSPGNVLDRKIQKVQTYLLNKMYRYIPGEDGERDYWYYRYKQYYIAQIRYLPDSIHQPSEKIIRIMDDMHKTSHALYDKPFRDKVLDKERYLPIAQMSYYLVSNEGYFTPFERVSYLERLFKFMDNKELFKKSIAYNRLLNNVYLKMKEDKEVAKEFEEHPYIKSLFYAALAEILEDNIVYDAHNGEDFCKSEKIRRLAEVIQDFYAWIFKDRHSSFHRMGERKKRQALWLYDVAINFSYHLSRYVCRIPYRYKDEKYLPEYRNKKELFDSAVTYEDFAKFTNTEKLLDNINNQNKER
ncbi:hypothetical protein [Hydrogenimonas sp. SS33]|uniref:hypothetical protein n=1 Tax=Hydrogenimonas leucolamina TaxID=2954236 RepID=UPI00336BF192